MPAKKLKLGQPGYAGARRAERQIILQQLEEIERSAHVAGLTITARGINNAKNACGWEMAGNTDMAEKSTRGVRAGELT